MPSAQSADRQAVEDLWRQQVAAGARLSVPAHIGPVGFELEERDTRFSSPSPLPDHLRSPTPHPHLRASTDRARFGGRRRAASPPQVKALSQPQSSSSSDSSSTDTSDSEEEMSLQAPQLAVDGDHHLFLRAFQRWASCQDRKKFDRERLIAVYLNCLPDAYYNDLESCVPDANFKEFRVPGYDNGDGHAVPPEGDMVTKDAVTWRLIHDFNVQHLRASGVIDADSARHALRTLKQGSAPVGTYITRSRRLYVDVHGSEIGYMDYVLEVIDGMTDEFTEKLRQQAPHVQPLFSMINEKRRNKKYVGMDPDQFQQSVQMDETQIRRNFKSLKRHEPYSPWVDGQVLDIADSQDLRQGHNGAVANYAINAVANNSTQAMVMHGAGDGVSGLAPSARIQW